MSFLPETTILSRFWDPFLCRTSHRQYRPYFMFRCEVWGKIHATFVLYVALSQFAGWRGTWNIYPISFVYPCGKLQVDCYFLRYKDQVPSHWIGRSICMRNAAQLCKARISAVRDVWPTWYGTRISEGQDDIRKRRCERCEYALRNVKNTSKWKVGGTRSMLWSQRFPSRNADAEKSR